MSPARYTRRAGLLLCLACGFLFLTFLVIFEAVGEAARELGLRFAELFDAFLDDWYKT